MLKRGDRVRVLEIHPDDGDPREEVGAVVELERAPTWYDENHAPGFMNIRTANGLTYARVELMTDDPAAEAVDLAQAFTSTLREQGEIKSASVQLSVRVPPPVPVFMSTDSEIRKLMPVATGVLKYFPDALLLVAWVSRVGNDKHNPGQPLHWAKEKSTDEPDCEVRHMLDFFRDLPPDPGLERLGRLGHLASKLWRACAHLQRECDKVRAEYENATRTDGDPVG